MTIVVVNVEGDEVEFGGATRFSTDDCNNLCIYEGPNADQLTHVFAAGQWREAGLHDDG